MADAKRTADLATQHRNTLHISRPSILNMRSGPTGIVDRNCSAVESHDGVKQ